MCVCVCIKSEKKKLTFRLTWRWRCARLAGKSNKWRILGRTFGLQLYRGSRRTGGQPTARPSTHMKTQQYGLTSHSGAGDKLDNNEFVCARVSPRVFTRDGRRRRRCRRRERVLCSTNTISRPRCCTYSVKFCRTHTHTCM